MKQDCSTGNPEPAGWNSPLRCLSGLRVCITPSVDTPASEWSSPPTSNNSTTTSWLLHDETTNPECPQKRVKPLPCRMFHGIVNGCVARAVDAKPWRVTCRGLKWAWLAAPPELTTKVPSTQEAKFQSFMCQQASTAISAVVAKRVDQTTEFRDQARFKKAIHRVSVGPLVDDAVTHHTSWRVRDSNPRRQSQLIYSQIPLAAWVTRQTTVTILRRYCTTNSDNPTN